MDITDAAQNAGWVIKKALSYGQIIPLSQYKPAAGATSN